MPLGVTFSFLISSPMVDLGSLVLLMSIFGAKVAVIYVVLGLVIAVAGGTLIEKLHLENQVEEFIRNAKQIDIPQEELAVKDRIKYAWEQVVETLKKVFPYILAGVGIGAFIHNWIPEDIIVRFLGTGNPFGVIITMYGIASLFLFTVFKGFIAPELATQYLAGAVLLGAAPCTAMVFVWSTLTKGNPAYTVVQVATNDLIILIAFVPIVKFLLGVSNVSVPYGTLFFSVILFVVIPLVGGVLTRIVVVKK